jgi:hypothetical protein
MCPYPVVPGVAEIGIEANPLILSAVSMATRGCAFMSYAVTKIESGLSLMIVMDKVPSPSAEAPTDKINHVLRSIVSSLRVGMS